MAARPPTSKRIIDLVLLLCALPLWFPLLCGLWILNRWKTGKPVFYRQRRAGLNGRPFDILKFRTMLDLRDAEGNLLPDEERLTPWGLRMRSLSLDEIPEILNVLRGDMSLVGPRPLPVRYLPRYSPEQRRRHECLPGITGWAQVNGRNLVDWDQRFQLDVWYVDHRNLWLDLRILWKTLAAVLRREGIAAENAATMHEFRGSGPDATGKPGPVPQPPGSDNPSRKSV